MFPFPGTTDWVQGAITVVACRNKGPTSSFPKDISKRQLKEENGEREGKGGRREKGEETKVAGREEVSGKNT